MSHKITCAIQALQKGYYVRSSTNVSAFLPKNPRGSDFSTGGEKKRCLMISVVIVTQIFDLLDQECFSSWKFSSTGWLGKLMMLLFCNFCCQHSLPYYWKNNPCKTLILFSWCREKEEWKTCQFFVSYTFHDSSTLFLKHKIPLQHSPKNLEKKDFRKQTLKEKKPGLKSWKKRNFSCEVTLCLLLLSGITKSLRLSPYNHSENLFLSLGMFCLFVLVELHVRS